MHYLHRLTRFTRLCVTSNSHPLINTKYQMAHYISYFMVNNHQRNFSTLDQMKSLEVITTHLN
jgi:hypothetical protein